MSKTVGASALAIIAVAGTAGVALGGPFDPIPADQRGIIGLGLLSADQYTLTATPIGSPGARGGAFGPETFVYDGIEFTSAYTAAATSIGYIGFDDYQTSTSPGGTFGGGVDFMAHHQWVGGLTGTNPTTGGVMFVTFFTAFGTPFSSYGVILGDGLFYYGITITNGMYIPADGVVQLFANDGLAAPAFTGAPGTWFYSTGAPTIGTNSNAFGNNAPDYNMHEIIIPAPASLAMLGLGGALAVRRRR